MGYKNKIIQGSFKENKLLEFMLLIFFISFFVYTSLLGTISEIQKRDIISLMGKGNLVVSNVDENKLEKIRSNDLVKSTYLEQHGDLYKEGKDAFQLAYFEGNPIEFTGNKLIQGRMPKSSNEFVAEKWVGEKLGYTLNSEYTLNPVLKNINKKYNMKLVGISEDIPANKSRGNLVLYVKNNNIIGKNSLFITLKNIDDKNKIKSFLLEDLGIDIQQIRENEQLNTVLRDISNIGKKDLSIVSGFGLVLILLVILISNINIKKRLDIYDKLHMLSAKKSSMFSLIFLRNIYFSLIPLLLSLPISLLLSNLFKNYLYMIDPDMMNRSVENVYYNSKIIFYIVAMIIASALLGVLDFTLIDTTYRGLKKIKKFDFRKGYDKQKNRSRGVVNFISKRFLSYYFRETIFVLILSIFGSSLIVYQMCYTDRMEYSNKKIVEDYISDQGNDISVTLADFNSEEISDEAISKIRTLKDESGEYMVSNISASGQRMGRIHIKEGIDDKIFEEMNSRYKTSLKGGLIKNSDGSVDIKSSIYTYNGDSLGIESGENSSLIYVPKNMEWFDYKNVEFVFMKDAKYTPDFIYGTLNSAGLDRHIFNDGKRTESIPYNGPYYTKEDYPQIVVSNELFKNIFGSIGYNSITLNVASGKDVDKVVKEVENVLGTYNVEVLNKSGERNRMTKSVDIHKYIGYATLGFVYILIAFVMINVYSRIYINKMKQIGIIRQVGAPRNVISRIMSSEIRLVLGISTLVTAILYMFIEKGMYAHFEKEGYYVDVFSYDIGKLVLAVGVNLLIGMVVYTNNKRLDFISMSKI